MSSNVEIIHVFLLLDGFSLKIDYTFNPIALRKAKIVYNFNLFECSRVNSPEPKAQGENTELRGSNVHQSNHHRRKKV